MQPAAPERIAQCGNSVSEQHERDGGRQSEAGPCRKCARIARARQPDSDSDLAARWPRQELTQRDKVGIHFFFEPFSANDEVIMKVAEMRDGSAKAREPEPKENEKNFPRRTLMSSCGRGCCVRDFWPVDHAHLVLKPVPYAPQRTGRGWALTVILAIIISKVDIVFQYGDCDTSQSDTFASMAARGPCSPGFHYLCITRSRAHLHAE